MMIYSSVGRPWKDEERLKEIGARLQKSGHIVVEDPAAELQTEPSSRELMSLPQNFYGDSSWDGALGQRVGVTPCPVIQVNLCARATMHSLSLCLACKHALVAHRYLCVACNSLLNSGFYAGKQQRRDRRVSAGPGGSEVLGIVHYQPHPGCGP